MSLDLNSAFLIFFPLTVAMVMANRFTVVNLPEQKFVRHWNSYLITWLFAYLAIFSQSYFPILGQLAVRACTPFFVFTYVRTIHTIVDRPRIPYGGFIALIVVTEIPMLAEIFFTGTDVIRAWIGSGHHLVVHAYGFVCLIRMWRAGAESKDFPRLPGYSVLVVLEAVFFGVWVVRTGIGILTVSSANAGILIEQSTYNSASMLMVPQMVLLLNLFIIVLSHSIETQRTAHATRQLLGRIADTRLLNLTGGFSHEISGHLGNLKLLTDTLKSRELSTEEEDTIVSLGKGAFGELRSIILERHRLAESQLSITEEVELNETLVLVNRLLSRGYLGRGVSFESQSPPSLLRISLRYLITVLSGIAELVVFHGRQQATTFKVEVAFDLRAGRQVLILSGDPLSWAGGALSGHPETVRRDATVQSHEDEKTLWLRAITGGYYGGELTVTDRSDSGTILEFSFEEVF